MNSLQTDLAIEHYLHAAETSLINDEASAQKSLKEKINVALEKLSHAEKHLEEDDRKEVSLLRSALDELHLQFALGKMEGKSKLIDLQKEVSHGIQMTKSKLKATKQLSEKEKNKILTELHHAWKELRFDLVLIETRIEIASDTIAHKIESSKDEFIKDIKTISQLAKEDFTKTKTKTEEWFSQTKKKVNARARKVLHTIEHQLLEP